jgi:hypothetical protein
MPSVEHEALVELFRNRGELAAALLDGHARVAYAHHHVEQASIDLSQVVSTEYRADAVTLLRDARNAAVAAIIVEVQLSIDRDKEYSWPVYVPALRARHRCPAVLLVIAPDPAVARWARSSIELGHPGFCLKPVVIEFAEMPRVTNGAEAQRVPELAVLSTIAHGDSSIAQAAIGAIEGLPEDQKRLYLDLIARKMSSGKHSKAETHVALTPGQQIIRKGLDERIREEHLGDAVLEVLAAKGYVATDDESEAINGWGAGPLLTELLGPLLRATTMDEIRELLATLPLGRDMFGRLLRDLRKPLDERIAISQLLGQLKAKSDVTTQAHKRRYELRRRDGVGTGLRTAVLALLRAKLDAVTPDQEAAIGELYDERLLTELVAALGRASNADDARGALAAAFART